MNSDFSLLQNAGDSSDDGEARPSGVRHVTRADGSVETWYEYTIEPRPPSFTFEHDKQKRLFVLKWPDGKTERFRDNPARQLVVEPDPETGEMRPVVRRAQPVYLYLCREEREL